MTSVSTFLDELLKREVVDSNPVAYVCDEVDFDPEEKKWADLSVAEIGNHLKKFSILSTEQPVSS